CDHQQDADDERKEPKDRKLEPSAHVELPAQRVGHCWTRDRVEENDADDVPGAMRTREVQVEAEHVRREAAPAGGLANPVRPAGAWRVHFSKPRVRTARSGSPRKSSICWKNHCGSSSMMKCRAVSAMAKCSFGSFAN